ncbi:hypothetical protein DL240_11385 [Lujinxingia litoralis]|uniref:Uncharacterized protein n=1 Tax=Lujinxingia litoralis TaxID=2211119 RepID=A0A328C548_9DELT|nr:hypothetical protein [Lujinxingia litoralis]RAL22441.1 hypothetical protein DL240_11385 [Lujinxingia litoralis]
MSSRFLPEAIRGAWFYVPEDYDLTRPHERTRMQLVFRIDGSFTRYQIKNDSRRPVENGDYTYDGNFLILRGRNTDTFRVKQQGYWRWDLEGKKKEQRLLRALVDLDAPLPLSDAASRDIRILPLWVKIHRRFQGPDTIFEAHYSPDDQDPQLVATFFIEELDEKRWIGITPLVTGIEPRTWERIIQDCLLDLFLGKPSDIGVVTLRLLDSGEARVFNYKTSS